MVTRSVMLLCILLAAAAVPSLAAEAPLRTKVTRIPQTTPAAAVPPGILSIIPAQAEPGSRVAISGMGFGTGPTVFLGAVEVVTQAVETNQVEFTIPSSMAAGLYALYLKRSDGTGSRSYNFTVFPVRPQLLSLEPAMISSCASGSERDIAARGKNFSENAQLYFDGAVLPAKVLSTDSITFVLPAVSGGLHQVLVKNTADTASVPLALAVETRPEISQVTVGEEHVNFYELSIMGRNFSQNSIILVDGVQIGGQGSDRLTEREKLIYLGCTRLVYQRHPYSPVNKDFRLQVVNGGGEGSQVITVSAP